MNKQHTTLKDFHILSRLGQGSFGQVFKVKRIKDGQIYAMKRVKINAMPQKDRENALNQIRILASQTSQYVVAYKEAFYDQATLTLNIIMEFAAEGDLLKKIENYQANRKHIPEQEIWKALVHMTYGLKSLHDKRIVHRDIKAANVFITGDGVYKLGDLNVSKVMKNQFAKTQIGTPFYTAPQIWKQRPYGIKCDMWSLGCVLYEMAAGKPPFNGRDLQGLYRKIVAGYFQRIPMLYSESLFNIIVRLLNQLPALRPSTDQILQLKSVHEHFKGNIEIPKMLSLQSKKLIGTIKMTNNNVKSLKNILPKANYEGIQQEVLAQSFLLQEDNKKKELPKFRIGKKSVKQILFGDRLAKAEAVQQQPNGLIRRIRSQNRIQRSNVLVDASVAQKKQVSEGIELEKKEEQSKVPMLDIHKRRQQHLLEIRKKRKQRMLSACGIRKLFEVNEQRSLPKKNPEANCSQKKRESISRSRNSLVKLLMKPPVLTPINSNKKLPPIPLNNRNADKSYHEDSAILPPVSKVYQKLQEIKFKQNQSSKRIIKLYRNHNQQHSSQKQIQEPENFGPKININRVNIIAKCGIQRERPEISYRID